VWHTFNTVSLLLREIRYMYVSRVEILDMSRDLVGMHVFDELT